MRERLIAIMTLAIPVLAGLAYLYAFGAPLRYLAINAAALGIAALWIAFAPSFARWARLAAIAAAMTLLFLPLASGPAVSGVMRWLPLGPFTLHAGMIAIPVLAALVGEEEAYAPGLLSLALLAALLQPDLATGAALMLAAVGLHEATRDWRYGLVAIVAFVVSIVAAMRGELPAQPFADRIVVLLALTDPIVALGLLMTLIASFFMIVGAVPGREASRKALAGSLFGFSVAGILSNYPSALIGYGAAAILGFGLALGLLAAGPAPCGSDLARRETRST